MRPKLTTTCALLCLTARTLAPTAAAGVKLEYAEDFSQDPGWITDQPLNYQWIPGTQTFRATTPNSQPGYAPSRFAYTAVDYDGGSFTLEFDIRPVSLGWSAGVAFGMFDECLQIAPAENGCPDPQYVHVHIGRVDPGIHLSLFVRGSSGVDQIDQEFNVISEGPWYHCALEYDAETDVVTLSVTEASTGAPVAELAVANVGGLPDDLDSLGFARDPVGDCCPGCPGFSCSNSATAELDNLLFSEAPPACAADLTGDGMTGLSDVVMLLAMWGPCPLECLGADLDGDGSVGFSDLLAILAAWGPCAVD